MPQFKSFADIVLYLAGIVVAVFLVPYLRQLAAANKAKAEKSKQDWKHSLLDRAKAMIEDAAAAVAEKKFPDLARKVVSGELSNTTEIKGEMAQWGQALRGQVVKQFGEMDVDVLNELGGEAIDRLIEQAANKASPFPGMETAAVIIQKPVAEELLKKGIQFVKDKAAQFECKACIPPCDGCKAKEVNNEHTDHHQV